MDDSLDYSNWKESALFEACEEKHKTSIQMRPVYFVFCRHVYKHGIILICVLCLPRGL